MYIFPAKYPSKIKQKQLPQITQRTLQKNKTKNIKKEKTKKITLKYSNKHIQYIKQSTTK
jgi:hypothetical protein